MIRDRLKQFKWRRNVQTFKLYAGALVALCVVNPSVAQTTYDQPLAPNKQLSSQLLCQCPCACPQPAPQSKPHKQKLHKKKLYTQVLHKQKVHKQILHKQKHKHLHAAHATASSKQVHPVHSVHAVSSTHFMHSEDFVRSESSSKQYSYSTVLYKPLSTPRPYKHKYPPLFISKSDSCNKIIFQAGAFNSYQGRTQDVNVNNVFDIYTVTNHNSKNVLLGLGYYIDGFHKPSYSLWYGLNAFYLAPSTVKGDILQEGLFPNLSYRYTVTQFPIYLDLKSILHTNSPKYDITLDFGAGPSIVSTSDIEEYAVNASSIPDKLFKGSTHVLPSVSAGVGFKVNNLFSNNKASVECGYRFFYTTQTKFNNYFGSTPTSGPLYTGNNVVNSVMCSIIL